MRGMRNLLALTLLASTALLMTSCIAYSVGTTARPVAQGDFQPNLVMYAIPNGVDNTGTDDLSSEPALAYTSVDFEGRWGLSDKSDLGLRVPAGSGAIVNYKRLLNGANDPDRVAISAIVGAGVVNFANHAYFEAGLIASGREDNAIPYGGIRAMHVIPISSGAVEDTPTAGFFAGVRFRATDTLSFSPEIGVYHDKSALHLREENYVIVPSLTIHWN